MPGLGNAAWVGIVAGFFCIVLIMGCFCSYVCSYVQSRNRPTSDGKNNKNETSIRQTTPGGSEADKQKVQIHQINLSNFEEVLDENPEIYFDGFYFTNIEDLESAKRRQLQQSEEETYTNILKEDATYENI